MSDEMIVFLCTRLLTICKISIKRIDEWNEFEFTKNPRVVSISSRMNNGSLFANRHE